VAACVVETVSVADPASVPVTLTGVVAPKLKVGKFAAPAGLAVRAALKVTLPVNPPLGVTLMVEMLPVVEPGATEIAVPLIAKF